MAGHLAAAGYPLTVLDVDRAAAEAVATAHPGVTVATTPRAVAAAADIVVTMLPSGAFVREVALGEARSDRGLRTRLRAPGHVVVRAVADPRDRRRPRRGRASTWSTLPCPGRAKAPRRPRSSSWSAGTPGRSSASRPLLDVLGRAAVPPGTRRRRARHEVHQQHDHRHDLHGHRRGSDHRPPLRPGPRRHDRRAERLDGHVVDQPDPHQAAHHQSGVRRPLQAGADDQGRRHRARPRGAQGPARSAGDPRPRVVGGGGPRRRRRRQHQRDGALGRNGTPTPRSPGRGPHDHRRRRRPPPRSRHPPGRPTASTCRRVGVTAGGSSPPPAACCATSAASGPCC